MPSHRPDDPTGPAGDPPARARPPLAPSEREARSERDEARRQRRLVIAMAAVAGALSVALALLRVMS